MITIPTTELIGGISDVLPIVIDNKESETWGVAIAWDGESLHFTAYDVLSAGSVTWVPGAGPEGEVDEDEDDIAWGGDDAPWSTFISTVQAKEIVKLFKLPAKFWRTPVGLKCSLDGGRLMVERIDGPRVDRHLTVPGIPDVLRQIPDVRKIAEGIDDGPGPSVPGMRFTNTRLGAFGLVRPHGPMGMAFDGTEGPAGVFIGERFAGYIYPVGAWPRAFSLLRDGAGLVTSHD